MDKDTLTATLKDLLAWFHGAIAGILNLDDPDPAVLAHLLKQLEAHRVLLEVLSARRE